MTYRIPKLETPVEDPFKHDALERMEAVDFLSGLIDRSNSEPLVLAIDAPYGSGKSTFVEMLRLKLDAKNYQTVYFDAWRADHVSDPLVAMVAALDSVMPKMDGKKNKVQSSLNIVRKVAGVVGRRGVVAAVKVATVGAVDLEEDVEEILKDFAGEATSDLVGEFQKEEKLIECFREALERFVNALPSIDKRNTLIFIIDELDRCRPNFAISLLERVKHMFDVPNIVFLLSVDKQQLEAATAAIYGERINASEYLRKFIDLEFGLAPPTSDRFINSALTRAGLDDVFTSRENNSETRSDRKNFVSVMFALSIIFGLSLRAQERCITRLRLVLEQTTEDNYLDPEHVALLIVLRLVDRSLFSGVVSGQVAPEELLGFIESKPEGRKVISSDQGRILRALILAEDRNEDRRQLRISQLNERLQLQNLPPDEYHSIADQITLIRHFSHWRNRRAGFAFKQAAKKIDLASQVRD